VFWWRILTVVLIMTAAVRVYLARVAWGRFTSRSGRRRFPLWLRGWWCGEQAQNRNDSWT
jgi:hypothetical protein